MARSSKPLMTGIWMSRKRTSGRSRWMTLSASSALAQAPITSKAADFLQQGSKLLPGMGLIIDDQCADHDGWHPSAGRAMAIRVHSCGAQSTQTP